MVALSLRAQARVDQFIDDAYEGRVKPVRATLERNARWMANARDSVHGIPVLHRAIEGGSLEVVQLLLQHGASTVDRDTLGRSATFVAAACGTTSILQCVLRAGGDVNGAAKDGTTPLVALLNGWLGDARQRLDVLLAIEHLDVTADVNGFTAEMVAKERGLGAVSALLAKQVRLPGCGGQAMWLWPWARVDGVQVAETGKRDGVALRGCVHTR